MEEYLDEVSLNDNPYEEMVDDCVKRQSQQIVKPPAKRPWVQSIAPNEFLPADFKVPAPPVSVQPDLGRDHHLNSTGVKITFNDDDDDIADLETRHDTKWVSWRLLQSRNPLTILLVGTSTVEDV